MSKLQKQCVEVLEISEIDCFIPYVGKDSCRPTKLRIGLGRTFTVKVVYNMPTTQILIYRLKSDLSLGRLCGYAKLE